MAMAAAPMKAGAAVAKALAAPVVVLPPVVKIVLAGARQSRNVMWGGRELTATAVAVAATASASSLGAASGGRASSACGTAASRAGRAGATA